MLLSHSSGGRVSNAWATCPADRDNAWKRALIPDRRKGRMLFAGKGKPAVGWARVALAGWWGNGSPRRRCVAGLRGWAATLGLRHGPDSYGRQQ